MNIQFGREICGHVETATAKEWLITNGIGGYACGTLSGILTRRYHGLLIAALNPPVQRTLLLAKVEETVHYLAQSHDLSSNVWQDRSIAPKGYLYLESFCLEKNTPIWIFAIADALLEKQIWMQQEENTTYIRYTLKRGSAPLQLSLKALVNYRDHHHDTQNTNWQMQTSPTEKGIKIIAFPDALPFYLFADLGNIQLSHDRYFGFDLAIERYRGLSHTDDHLHIATFNTPLDVNQSITLIASTESTVNLDGNEALTQYYHHQDDLISLWQNNVKFSSPLQGIEQLILAADQFIVNRSFQDNTAGKTIIAGYPWFSDWGRDTAISLCGLTLVTGRFEVARQILRTFSCYLNQGMLPNYFPDAGETPIYNTVDAIFWYFESINQYFNFTNDLELISQLFPLLKEVIDWHCRGTRYHIHLDRDGLIYAGETGVQLTWMDAKVENWVVTPRIGKPVEINALWVNALAIMVKFANLLGYSATEYENLGKNAKKGFQRFWNDYLGYCYDVLDAPTGNDATLRPNQIFAVSLEDLLNKKQEKAIVDIVSQKLLTSYGLRSLSPNNSDYQGQYGGDRFLRDGAYHQGTGWGWLMGHFVQAHLKVYQNPEQSLSFLMPMLNHLQEACLGTLSEIFDGDPPFSSRGCFAQAWSVAEVLRGIYYVTNSRQK